ncbi:MAG: hypothetical protein HYY96_14710 [Candidatus Tectomicrobia bacterium]|nr:hypothetical protein [Candidatus Tectomicrobia bacterium]
MTREGTEHLDEVRLQKLARNKERFARFCSTIVDLQVSIRDLKQECADLEEQIAVVNQEIARHTTDYQGLSPLLDDLTRMFEDAKSGIGVEGEPHRDDDGGRRSQRRASKTAASPREDQQRHPPGPVSPRRTAAAPSAESASRASESAAGEGLLPMAELDDISSETAHVADDAEKPRSSERPPGRTTPSRAADKPWLRAAEHARRLREQSETVKADQSPPKPIQPIVDEAVADTPEAEEKSEDFDIGRALKHFNQDANKKNRSLLNKVFGKKQFDV